MKITTRLLVMLLLSIVLQSCDNDSTTNNYEPEESYEMIEPGVLSSIYLERFNCNESTATVNFENNEIINVIQDDGGKSEFSYTDGLLSERLVYHINDYLLFTYTYSYDSEGRITEIIRDTNYDNPTVQSDWDSRVTQQYGYDNSNYITKKEFWYAADGNLRYESLTEYYYLNSQQQIIKYENYGWYEDYAYINNNPHILNNSIDSDNLTMTHYVGVNLNGYRLKEYMFGEHWKNNSILAYFNILVGRTIIELSGDDLLKSFEAKDADGIVEGSLDVQYEVDELGRLKNQYREFTYNGASYSEKVTYFFED